MYLGMHPGFYTTAITLLFSMPVILGAYGRFQKAELRGRLKLAALLTLFYGLAAILSVALISGIAYTFLHMQCGQKKLFLGVVNLGE
ncbi:hypothetical protein [Paenibacillus sp. PL2-23]|uniref:hypothetical protein n=1 Tax=Paenibacillus sp. PL2-23 TaxID=2100729 RepID=UPI0030F671D2